MVVSHCPEELVNRYEREKLAVRFWTWIAWRLPRRLVYWAVIRAATKPPEGNVYPADRTASEILKTWP
jgi:hypothetical protein